MKVYVDIDDTICYYGGDKRCDYTKAKPYLMGLKKLINYMMGR